MSVSMAKRMRLDDSISDETLTENLLDNSKQLIASQLEQCSEGFGINVWVDGLESKREPTFIENVEELEAYWVDLGNSLHSSSLTSVNICSEPCSLRGELRDSCFKRRMYTCVIHNTNCTFKDPKYFLQACFTRFNKYVQEALRQSALKVNTSLEAEYIKPTSEEVQRFNHNTKNEIITATTDLQEWYTEFVVKPILSRLGEFQERDSGWALREPLNLHVNINHYSGFHVGGAVKLPKAISNRHAVVNVESKDNACFAWSIVSALHPAKTHVNRVSSYPHYSKVLNLQGIPMPMELQNLEQFERQNKLSVNVYGAQYENGDWVLCGYTKRKSPFTLVPIYISRNNESTRRIHLLLLQKSEYSSSSYHFAWIKNMSRLISPELSKHRGAIHVCERCLSYFYSQAKLEQHMESCSQLQPATFILPTEADKMLEFEGFKRKEIVPFVIYADLESYLKPIPKQPNAKPSSTEYKNQHVAHSIAFYVHCSFKKEFCSFDFHRGDDCCEWFVNRLCDIVKQISKYYASSDARMEELTSEQQHQYNEATACHICEQPFGHGENCKVRDHCHLTGKYRGPAHSSCNLLYRLPTYVPVIFHNLSGYDSHFLIRALCERRVCVEGNTALQNPGSITLIPSNMERYKSFTKRIPNYLQLRFIDSFNFLHCSLEEYVSYLNPEDLRITRYYFPDPSEFSLVHQKGVFPYEYVSDMSVLNETQLPPRHAFYSSLTKKTIEEEQYERAKCVWETFRCRTLGDYSDIYLKTDVLLLADVFENFRNLCKQTYGLDPAHYITGPSLSWDALLKKTSVKLELLTDIDMVYFIEQSIRGGVVFCSHRSAQANNKYMSSYDANQPDSYLLYLDVNNLYGWAMMQPLPISDFSWVENPDTFDVTQVDDNAEFGFILEVDLVYPEQVHDAHKDFPLCPTKMKPPTGSSPKLLSTLYNKERYTLHYRTLKQCLQYGLQCTRIYRILQFKQTAWMRPYIELNTEKRKQSTSKFESNFYKLMNNSVFGRTLMNVRKFRDVKLVSQWGGRHGAARLIAQPNFKKRVIFDEHCAAIEMEKLKIKCDKPMYVGMTILDLAKLKLASFHYDYMRPKYPHEGQLVLCYTDTDSLLYLIHTNDVYRDIQPDVPEWFDTGDFKPDNPYQMPRCNSKEIGFMKDEMKGEIITKFIGLRAKMYALETERDYKHRAKGVMKSVPLTMSDYEDCLHNDTILMCQQESIRSQLHDVFTVRQQKVALSSDDDKRFVLPDGISTLPWGHYNVHEQ